ncbi:hypothetical protein N7481_001377 [Penicillium waksmanii]|uniref:uncharacterized protein n=1 Tax=Penicillium waksmanii TaxID=69791 RepID=UPI002548A859|nr:uncharacterized protein N7481_001377 [Penicillium waksmanii]KAJ6000968.1 hypothetical protein N7481_001377 [Penicillium waksmanii]
MCQADYSNSTLKSSSGHSNEDPSPVERVARKYSCKNYAPYDVSLHSLCPDHCYRTATGDGSDAIFLISAHGKKKLAAEETLDKEKQLVSMASQVITGAVRV